MKKIVCPAALLAICAGILSASALALTSQLISVPLTSEQNDGQAPTQYPYLLRHDGEILFPLTASRLRCQGRLATITE
jgi:hypothetical protein